MSEELIPLRMLNEVVYCRRLFWLEYVAREFEHSYDTIDGARVHRNVDRASGVVPQPDEALLAAVDPDLRPARSVSLSSPRLGITGTVDVVEVSGRVAAPIDFKRGTVPKNEERSYPPERVQLCLQGLLLREAGYECNRGYLYFAASRARVEVEFTDQLVTESLEAIATAKRLLESGTMPPPLVDSPKCPRCSLVGICLPDETNALRAERAGLEVRPLSPPGGDAQPLYVVKPGAFVGKSGDVIQVRKDGELLQDVRLIDLSHICIYGNVQVSTQALRALLDRNIPVFYLSFGGWLSGMSVPASSHSIDVRIAQFRIAADVEASLPIARSFVEGKIRNQRTLVRRSLGSEQRRELGELSLAANRAAVASSLEELLGHEGIAARIYFGCFKQMLRDEIAFDFRGRNRRPPRDPVNAALSFLYALLVKDCTAAVIAVGLEPSLGLYHRVRLGRPSLALDLAEEFRPLLADSVALAVFNMAELTPAHFVDRGIGVTFTDDGRRTLIDAYERRLASTITHPIFGYSTPYRRVLGLQARLLARRLEGDIPTYPPFMTR